MEFVRFPASIRFSLSPPHCFVLWFDVFGRLRWLFPKLCGAFHVVKSIKYTEKLFAVINYSQKSVYTFNKMTEIHWMISVVSFSHHFWSPHSIHHIKIQIKVNLILKLITKPKIVELIGFSSMFLVYIDG